MADKKRSDGEAGHDDIQTVEIDYGEIEILKVSV